MSYRGRRGMFGGPGDYTRVSKETEVIIPRLTYKDKCLFGSLGILGVFLISSWITAYQAGFSVWQWGKACLWWLEKNWALLPITVVGWCITIPLWAYLFRLFTEQILKRVDLAEILGIFMRNRRQSRYRYVTQDEGEDEE